MAVDGTLHDIAGVQLVEKLEGPLHGVLHPLDIHALFEPGGGFGTDAQGPGGAADAVPPEFGAFEEEIPGVVLDFTVQPAHNPGQTGGGIGVGDDQHVVRQGMLPAIQGGDGFPRPGAADDDPRAPHVPQIEGVHGLAGLQHDEVGDVHDVVDGPHPRRPQGCLHPFRGGGDPQVLHHPAEVAGTEVVILYRDADVFPDVSALGAVGRDRRMKIGAQGHRDLPGDTQDALAVGAVGGNLEIDDHIVKAQDLPHIGTGVLPQDEDAVDLRAGVVGLPQAQLLPGAEHPLGGQAPQFAALDMGAVRQPGIVQGGGDQRPLKHIVGAGDDLDGGAAAHIHAAQLQLIGVGMLPEPEDPGGDHVFHGLRQVLDIFHFETRHDHPVAQFLDRNRDIDVASEPIEGYFHRVQPFLP